MKGKIKRGLNLSDAALIRKLYDFCIQFWKHFPQTYRIDRDFIFMTFRNLFYFPLAYHQICCTALNNSRASVQGRGMHSHTTNKLRLIDGQNWVVLDVEWE